jgi:hypothetical protein
MEDPKKGLDELSKDYMEKLKTTQIPDDIKLAIEALGWSEEELMESALLIRSCLFAGIAGLVDEEE